jgi:hypothetical protein
MTGPRLEPEAEPELEEEELDNSLLRNLTNF